MKKKRLLTLMVLAVMAVGAWADFVPYITIQKKNGFAATNMTALPVTDGKDAIAWYEVDCEAVDNTFWIVAHYDKNANGVDDPSTDKSNTNTISYNFPEAGKAYFYAYHLTNDGNVVVISNLKRYQLLGGNWVILGEHFPSPGRFNVYFNRAVSVDKVSDVASYTDTSNSHLLLPKDAKDRMGQFTVSDPNENGVNKMTIDYLNGTMTFEKVTKLPVTISDAGASTLVLPAQATIPDGVKAYKLKYENSVLKATELTSTIPANTPVLLNGEPDTYDFDMGENEVTYTTNTENVGGNRTYIKDVNRDENFTDANNVLVGVMQPHYVPTGSYVLQIGDNGLGFYYVDTANYRINQFRCYLTLPAAEPGAHALTIVYDDENTTGVKNVKNTTEEGSNEIYNLSGQRVGKDYKGVVVKNGRKMIQK